jgi:glycosyltransferase involved in cell wall biosynthesis
LIGLHDRGAEVRVLAPPHAVYAPLLTSRQVAVEPWTTPRIWDVASLKDLRHSLALFQPDLVVLRGSAISAALLLGVAGAGARIILFIDLFEGDQLPGLLQRLIAARARLSAIVYDLTVPAQPQLEGAVPLTMIPPGHDPDWYSAGPELNQFGIPERAFTVGAVAAGLDDDRLVMLIEAARWLPMDLPIHFLLFAPPEDHEILSRLIRRNPFPQRFHLADDFGTAPGVMAQCNLFVGLRWDSEPVRRTLLHCLHHGVPCLAEDSPLARSVINPGVSGLVVPRRDPGALARALSEFYENPEQRDRLRLGAAREASSRFAMDRLLQQTLDLLEAAATHA